jgi:hypothetical protein
MIGNMNNLIYFSLTWVGMYAREIQSPEHPYHKWFTLHSVALWPKHTTSRVHKLDTPWDLAGTVCPMPKITNNEFDFGRVIESIADDFCQLVKHTGKIPYICWSGGIDSTSILVSILKVAPADILKDLVILCNDRSIVENTHFYYKYIDKKFKIQDIDQLEITSENYDKIIIVDGEAGNQVFGHNSVQKLMYTEQYDLLNKPWKSINDLSTLLIDATDFHIQLVKESIAYAPVPIETGYDFLWWVNFNFKFDEVLLRKAPSYTRNLTPEQTKLFWNESLYRFYAHPTMQIWSMLAKDIRRESLKITPKYHPKKYIYDFDHNDYWLYNKREEGSSSDVTFVDNYTPMTTPLFAIDEDWTKYVITDKSTRLQLGSILKRK